MHDYNFFHIWWLSINKLLVNLSGRHVGLVIRVHISRLGTLSLIPGCGHCVVFFAATVAFLPRCVSGYRSLNLILGVTLHWTSIPTRKKKKLAA